mmetsp:Transcript_2450/g.3567  ORF Transcript_2450/g.3567 Transcript_2450/m.3567 type:complete len:626 (+) Transcript_2450:29-1906(+)
MKYYTTLMKKMLKKAVNNNNKQTIRLMKQEQQKTIIKTINELQGKYNTLEKIEKGTKEWKREETERYIKTLYKKIEKQQLMTMMQQQQQQEIRRAYQQTRKQLEKEEKQTRLTEEQIKEKKKELKIKPEPAWVYYIKLAKNLIAVMIISLFITGVYYIYKLYALIQKKKDERFFWNQPDKLESIMKALAEKPITNVEELREFMKQHTKSKGDLEILEAFFEEDKEAQKLLPYIQTLALELKTLKPQLFVLEEGKTDLVCISQRECCCILAGAFFSLYDHIDDDNQFYADLETRMPSANFRQLFLGEGTNDVLKRVKIEKLKFIFNYFARWQMRDIEGYDDKLIAFYRRAMPEDLAPQIMKNAPFTSLVVDKNGKIEDTQHHLMVDFANKYIGGSVLHRGAVQEEILFLIYPELFVSRLITPVIGDKEAVVIAGAERYASYTGYSRSLKYAGNFVDQSRESEKIYANMVAIDAIKFTDNIPTQFTHENIDRELIKAFVGFSKQGLNSDSPFLGIISHHDRVATGNWGCGVFKGDKQLKFVIQWMAASLADKDVTYFTFNDPELEKHIDGFKHFVMNANVGVNDIYNALLVVAQKGLNEQRHPQVLPEIEAFLKRPSNERDAIIDQL